MKMVIVTLTYRPDGVEKSYDMEMPCDVPARILGKHICQTLENYTGAAVWQANEPVQLYCQRLNRMLSPSESLEQAGVWNGDHMELRL